MINIRSVKTDDLRSTRGFGQTFNSLFLLWESLSHVLLSKEEVEGRVKIYLYILEVLKGT